MSRSGVFVQAVAADGNGPLRGVWPRLGLLALATSGQLTSIALQTRILVRRMGLRQSFLTAIGLSFIPMSFISTIAMETVMDLADVALTEVPQCPDGSGRRYRRTAT